MIRLLKFYFQTFQGIDRNVWILSLALLVNRSGSMILLFLPLYLTQELKMDIADSGWIMSAFGVGSIIGSYLGGWLTDRRSFFDIQVGSLFIGGTLIFGLLIFQDFWGILITVFLHSLAADSFRPANSVAISTFSSPENKTRSFTLMRMAINLGFSIGPALGGLAAVTLGYHTLFIYDAITCIAAALILIFLIPKKDMDAAKSKKLKEKQTETDTLSAYQDTPYLTFVLGVVIYGICFFQLFASVPIYLKSSFGYPENFIGNLIAFNGLLIVFFEMPIINKIGNFPRPLRMIAIGCGLMALAFLCLVLGGSSLLGLTLFIIFITFSEILVMPFMINIAIGRPHASRQGQYMALYSIAYGLAHIISPAMGMKIAKHFGFSPLYIFIILASLVLGIWNFNRKPMLAPKTIS